MSSCSRRQPRWDSRLSNNQHARPRRMPGGTLATKFVRACSKMLRPSVTQVKSTLPPIKTILIAKSDLLAELSASSLKRAGVCGTFRKFLASVRGVCGTFRKLTQVCGAFAEVSASFSQVCGAFAEVSASSLKCAGRLRNFPQAHSSVRGVCGTFRKHALFLKIVIDFVRKTSDSARRPRGEIRKTAFSVRNTYVRCG